MRSWTQRSRLILEGLKKKKQKRKKGESGTCYLGTTKYKHVSEDCSKRE